MAIRMGVCFVSLFLSGWFYGIATLSQLLPVWTPVLLAAAQAASAGRLASSCGVLTVAPQKAVVCGKVRVAAFDKTGTLTESHLAFSGERWQKRRKAEPSASSPEALKEGRRLGFNFFSCPLAGLVPAPLSEEQSGAGVTLSAEAIRALRFDLRASESEADVGDFASRLAVACAACCHNLSVFTSPSAPASLGEGQEFVGSSLERE